MGPGLALPKAELSGGELAPTNDQQVHVNEVDERRDHRHRKKKPVAGVTHEGEDADQGRSVGGLFPGPERGAFFPPERSPWSSASTSG